MAKGFRNSIENVFNKMMLYTMLSSLITIIMGILVLVFPELSNKAVGVFVGISLLVIGLTSVYKYLHRDGAKLFALNLTFSIVYIALGAIIIVYPYKVMEFVTICLGIFFIINGLNKGNYAIWLKKGNEDAWLVTLGSGVLLIIIGLLLIFNPFAGLTLTQLVGAFLIVTGIIDFTDAFLFKQRANEIREIFW